MPIEQYPAATTTPASTLSDFSSRLVVAENSLANVNTRYGFRNNIRNGDMSIWQRGAGPFTGSSGHSADGWRYAPFDGTVTYTRVTPTSTPDVMGAPYIMQVAVSGQTSASASANLFQRMENVWSYAGKPATVSFTAWAASGTPKIAAVVAVNGGTGASAATSQQIGTVTIGTTPTRYSMTMNVASWAGLTLGTPGTEFLNLLFYFSGGSSNADAQGIGIQNNTFNITDIQFESGTQATPFERLPRQIQLAWCQRYLARFTGVGSNAEVGAGMSTSASLFRVNVSLAVPLRALPTVTLGGTVALVSGGPGSVGSTTVSSISAVYWVPNSCNILLECVPAISLTPGYPVFVATNATSSDFLQLSAEQ
jgi:hypothetical protein